VQPGAALAPVDRENESVPGAKAYTLDSISLNLMRGATIPRPARPFTEKVQEI